MNRINFGTAKGECLSDLYGCEAKCQAGNDYCLVLALKRLQAEDPRSDMGTNEGTLRLLERGCRDGIQQACDARPVAAERLRLRAEREQSDLLNKQASVLRNKWLGLKTILAQARAENAPFPGRSPDEYQKELDGRLQEASAIVELDASVLETNLATRNGQASFQDGLKHAEQIFAEYRQRFTEVKALREAKLNEWRLQVIAQRRAEAEADLRKQRDAEELERAAAERLIPQIPTLFALCQHQRNVLEDAKRSAHNQLVAMSQRGERPTTEFMEKLNARLESVGKPWSDTLEKLRVAIEAKTNAEGAEYVRLVRRVESDCSTRF